MSGKPDSMPYAPGLDGLRALALIPVLLFHLEVPNTDGGFMGVSLFFTISGYLITQLLLREMRGTGRIDLARFWGRRVRRLWPAAVLCLVLVLVLSLVVQPFSNGSTKGDLLASVFNAANWRFVATKSSYDDIFLSAPSPLLHFWSLAIEEQFYFVLPALAAVTARWKPAAFRPIIIAAAAASLFAGFATHSHTLFYYGTHTRAFELLVGALLAFLVPLPIGLGQRTQRVVSVLSLPAIVGFGILVIGVSSTTNWLYRGGFPAFTLLSCLLILSVCTDTPLRAIATTPPLVWIGTMSYGVYLFHWPLYRLLTPERLHVQGVGLGVIRLCAAFAVAIVSYAVIETPIRYRRVLRTPSIGAIAYAVSAVLLCGAVAFSTGVNAERPRLAGLGVSDGPVLFEPVPEPPASTALADGDAVTPGSTAPPSVAKPVVRILVLGSQLDLVPALGTLVNRRYELSIEDHTSAGCPIMVIGYTELPAGCTSIEPALADRSSFDLVVVGTGQADRTGIPPDTETNLQDRAIAYGLLDPAMSSLHRLVAGGVPVVFVDHIPNDALGIRLRDLDDGNPSISLVTEPEPLTALTAVIETQTRIATSRPAELKVLVVGDSTSFGVASALSRAASGRLQVLWGGGQNCPVVAVAEVKWWDGAQWDMSRCPTPTRSWPDLVSGFKPDVVFAIASLPEQSLQRYVPGGPWYQAGDAAFVEAHNLGMTELQALLAPVGTLTIVANAPLIVEGGFSGGDLGSPTRIAAWNAQITTWDQDWGSVTTLDWAGAIATAEAVGYHRPDGVHFEQDKLDELVKAYLVDDLIATAHKLSTSATELGCLTAAHQLDLAACATQPVAPING